jgi:sec-independent protein translocase protein TatA
MILLGMIGMIGAWQVVIIIFAIILLFGGRKIPELMKGISQGMKEFKKVQEDDKQSSENEKTTMNKD